MATKTKLDFYIYQLNKLINSRSKILKSKPFFRSVGTGVKDYYKIDSSCSGNKIFLDSKIANNFPYIEIKEEWKNDERYKYSYKFVIPYFNFTYIFGDFCKPAHRNFEFRYEFHPEIKNHWPVYHLHVFDNIIPTYPACKIPFREFFKIIDKSFTKNDRIEFDYY